MNTANLGGTAMDLRFTEEQLMMRNMVRDFAKEEIAPFIDRMEEGELGRPGSSAERTRPP